MHNTGIYVPSIFLVTLSLEMETLRCDHEKKQDTRLVLTFRICRDTDTECAL